MTLEVKLVKEGNLIDQFNLIKSVCFKESLNISSFGHEDSKFDQSGHFVLFLDGDKCVGGARINGIHGEQDDVIPLEEETINFHERFNGYSLKSEGYCQWGRLAILPEYRSRQNIELLFSYLGMYSLKLGFSHLFSVSDEVRARLYRKIAKKFGFEFQILNDVEFKVSDELGHLPHIMSYCDLSLLQHQLDGMYANTNEAA